MTTEFNEARFERHLAEDPSLALAACWYWIRKLQARFFAGDYASAFEAASRAQRLLWTSPALFETAEYHFYAALAQAALCDASAVAGQRAQHLEALGRAPPPAPGSGRRTARKISRTAPRWSARRSRASRAASSMPCASTNRPFARPAPTAFVHNEALANELAARFYAARGFEKIAHVYLRNARYGYLRWGADGKVRQLDELYPHLRRTEPRPAPTSTIGAPVEHLDLATVIKVSQAVSGEIVLEKLIDTLMRTAIEQAGAERGLLILPRGAEQRIAAEATTTGDTVIVHLRDEAADKAVLPESVLHICPAHPGERHSRRRRGAVRVCRGSLHP